jgi:hypothetical protein
VPAYGWCLKRRLLAYHVILVLQFDLLLGIRNSQLRNDNISEVSPRREVRHVSSRQRNDTLTSRQGVGSPWMQATRGSGTRFCPTFFLFRVQPFSAESRILSTTSRFQVNQTYAERLKKLEYKRDAFSSRLCKALWTGGWTRPRFQTQPQSRLQPHVIRLPTHWMSTKIGGELGRLYHQNRCRMTYLCSTMD